MVITVISKKILLFILFVFINVQTNADNPDGKTGLINKDILIKDGNIIVTRKDALLMLSHMTFNQKQKVLADEGKFKRLLFDLIVTRKKAQEARAQKLDEDPLIKWKINRLIDQQLVLELTGKYSDQVTIPENIKLLAKEEYDTHPLKYTIEEKVNVSHILFSTENLDEESKLNQFNKAKDMLIKLTNGQDFADSAKKYSDDLRSARNGGKIGYISRGNMVKPFEDAAFSLKTPNSLSEIIETKFGYHIIKLLDRVEASIIPYQSVQNKLIEKQSKKYRQQITRKYMDGFGINKNTIIYLPSTKEFFNSQAKLLNQ